MGSLPPPLESSVEIIDLTDEDYLNEFKNFISTNQTRRDDKEAKKHKTKARSKFIKRMQCLPVDYLEHIRFQQDSFIYEILQFSFTKLMLYGRITAQTVKDDSIIYTLDDGTGAVNVFYRSGNKKYAENLAKLEHCDDILAGERTPLNEESVPDSEEMRKDLQLLILMAKAQCTKHLNPINIGMQCFVVGNPFIGQQDRVCVFAHSIFPDDARGRSCEIFWKTHLLSIYEPLITPTAQANSDKSINNLIEAMDLRLLDGNTPLP